jgi:hemoglobin/transferrin/lactoferrin receptor protein
MEDTLLNVTVDGAPQTGTLFHHIGRVNVEPELLKQVQVQAGAGEATAGFGAIGGAVRFRTKDATDLLDDGQNIGGLIKASTFSNNGEKYSLTGYGRLSDTWSAMASYVNVDRDNMEDGDGNTLYGTSAKQELAYVKVSGEISENQHLAFSFENRDEEGEFGQRPNWPALEGDILYPGQAERQTLVLNYGLEGGKSLNLEATAYLTKSDFVQDRFDAWGRYGADIDTFGFDIRNTMESGRHVMTYGVEHRSDEVGSRYLDDGMWEVWAWEPTVGEFVESGTAAGVYFQDHYQATDRFLLSFGVRYDMYDFEAETYGEKTDSDGISPNLGFEYSLSNALTFSLGYAQAIRGKEISDAFTLEKRPGRTRVQEGLQPEEVDNWEAALMYDNGELSASIAIYRSEIDNVILDQIGPGAPPEDGIFFENAGTFEVDGVELELGYAWSRGFLDFSYSHTSPEFNGAPVEGYEHNGLANARGDTYTLGANFDLTDRIQIGWRVVHVQDLNDIEVLARALEIGWVAQLETIDKEGYTVHDLYSQWLPLQSDRLKVHFAVQNIFDEAYRDHSSVGDYTHIPDFEIVAGVRERGRDVRLSFTVDF